MLLPLSILHPQQQHQQSSRPAGGPCCHDLRSSSSRQSSRQSSPTAAVAGATPQPTMMMMMMMTLTRSIRGVFILLSILAFLCALKMHSHVSSWSSMDDKLRSNNNNGAADENLPLAVALSRFSFVKQPPNAAAAAAAAKKSQASYAAAALAARKRQGILGNTYNNKNTNVITPLPTISTINSTKYTMSNTNVPFVYMVFKRVDYLQRSMESLAQSDYPKERLPVIISHDGHVPDVLAYVETLQRSNGGDFEIIQLFHPYSCYEHPHSFPANDTALNHDYTGGDWYGNTRSHWATCCKHHFTWMLNQVFQMTSQNVTANYTNNSSSNSNNNNSSSLLNNVDTFLFTEEDYLVAPNVYSAIVAGLNVMDSINHQVPGGGFLGLGLDPTNNGMKKQTVKEVAKTKAVVVALNITPTNAPWKADAFRTGPMTLHRDMFFKMQRNAHAHYAYCTYDDYNWDWSLEHLTRKRYLPYTILMPGGKVVQHIGSSGGMHSDNLKKETKRAKMLRDEEASFLLNTNNRTTTTTSTTTRGWIVNQRVFDNVTVTVPKKVNPGNGGWGHATDHAHCLSLFQW